jgi:hypothetical protein
MFVWLRSGGTAHRLRLTLQRTVCVYPIVTHF